MNTFRKEFIAIVEAQEAMSNLKRNMRPENDDHPYINKVISTLANMRSKTELILRRDVALDPPLKDKVTAYHVSSVTGCVKLGDKIPLEFYMPKHPFESALCLNTIATEESERGQCTYAKIHPTGVIEALFGFGDEHDNDQYNVVFGLDKELVRKKAFAIYKRDEE